MDETNDIGWREGKGRERKGGGGIFPENDTKIFYCFYWLCLKENYANL